MSEGKLPRKSGATDRLDGLLAAWPTRERPAVDWDESAERVLAVIASGEETHTNVSDEDLFGAPLPAGPTEVQGSAPIETRIETRNEGTGMSTASRERDRASFRDLARLANMTPPPSGPVSGVTPSEKPVSSSTSSTSEPKEREENSGVINLAALAASEAPASSAAPAASGAVNMATLRSSGTPPKVSELPAPAAKTAAPRKGRAWMTIGGLVAAAAVAAGVFFGVHHGASTPAMAVATPATPAATVPVATASAMAMTTPVPAEDKGVDPTSLPAATSTAALPGASQALAMRPPTKAGSAGGAPTTDPALVATIPAHAAPPAGTSDLQTLMQQAAGVTSSPTPAATNTTEAAAPAPGSVPLKPSQGALQGALGAVLPAARACLGPDDPISHATITFGSDGSVTNVGVSGGAAGKPAEACIRAALKRARVQPFAQPTFTATATVRPN